MKTKRILSALVIGLLCAGPAFAQLPKKTAPRGMLEVASGGTGRILTSHMGGTSSSRKLLIALKMISGEYFDKPFKTTRAFVDPNDKHLQAAFTASLKGIPVHGVVAITMNGGSGQGTLLFDSASKFTSSFGALLRKQTGGTNKGNIAPVKLIRQSTPDGSAQISLPAGFRIADSFKGTLDIVGPDEAYMGLGGAMLCTRPEAANMFPGMPAVDFNDPVRAMLGIVNYNARKAGTPIRIKILDAKPVPGWTAGRAAYIRYSLTGAGRSLEGFGLFSIAQTDVNQALFYQSFMVAKTANFQKQFPGMLRAWGSYSINPSVFTERLLAAAQTMRGISDTITSSYANQQKSNARVNEAWSDYIRDQSTWKDTGTNDRYKVSNTITNGGGIPMVDGVALEPVPLNDL